MNTFDVVIVGAGPAGIFAALELSKTPGLRIAILDKGRDIDQRRCPIREGSPVCLHCKPCAILNGWGGAGAFSDGKLTLSPAVGGHLAEILGEGQASALIREADEVYCTFGAPETVHGTYTDEIELLEKRASLAGLRFISVPSAMGTEHCVDIMRRMHDTLLERGVEIRMRTPASGTSLPRMARSLPSPPKPATPSAQAVILAPGRESVGWKPRPASLICRSPATRSTWASASGPRRRPPAHHRTPHLRIEVHRLLLQGRFDDKIRTFCMCPYGEVSTEFAGDIHDRQRPFLRRPQDRQHQPALLVGKETADPSTTPSPMARASPASPTC